MTNAQNTNANGRAKRGKKADTSQSAQRPAWADAADALRSVDMSANPCGYMSAVMALHGNGGFSGTRHLLALIAHGRACKNSVRTLRRKEQEAMRDATPTGLERIAASVMELQLQVSAIAATLRHAPPSLVTLGTTEGGHVVTVTSAIAALVGNDSAKNRDRNVDGLISKAFGSDPAQIARNVERARVIPVWKEGDAD